MSTPATIHRDDIATSERRGCPRDPLGCVALVFFGDKNWGRAIDINENGMRFEFAQPPELLKRLNFTIETMSGTSPLGEEITGMPFQAYGQIVWLQEFERNAGVRFEPLQSRRAQFRRWLSFATPSRTPALADRGARERQGPRLLPKPFEDLVPSCETPELASIVARQTHLEIEATLEPHQKLESRLGREIIDAPKLDELSKIFEREKHEQVEEEASKPNPRRTRAALVGATVVLTVLAAVGGVRMSAPLWAHKADSAEHNVGHSAGQGEPVKAGYGSAAGSRGPFLVEVSDNSNHRWLLWFAKDTAEKASNLPASNSGTSSLSFADAVKAPVQKPALAPAKNRPSLEFKPITPIVSRAPANGSSMNSAAAAPVIADQPTAPLSAAIGNLLPRTAVHGPVAPAAPLASTASTAPAPSLSSEIQEARLISAVPAVYPPLAKSNHVEGDVTVDALVDSTGRVTDVKVISGSPILGRAAVNAVREWRYEPARLRGRPEASHMTVTMRFHYDQNAQ